MGCYPPLVKFVSRALGKCNGRERWREERLNYAVAYPPGPPMETHYMRPVARTVNFASNNNVYVIPPQKPSPPPPQQEQKQSTPEPSQQPETPPQHEPDHQDTPPPQPQPEEHAPAQEKAPDAPQAPAEPKPPKGAKRGKNKKPGGRVRFGPEPPPPQEQQPQQEQHAPDPGNAPGQEGQQHGRHGPQAGPVPAYLFRYTPSPLPRWEATPRRHEYFSGEYRSYYPTPVREGIYRIATDANRLTTIFSEENPNACAIV